MINLILLFHYTAHNSDELGYKMFVVAHSLTDYKIEIQNPMYRKRLQILNSISA